MKKPKRSAEDRTIRMFQEPQIEAPEDEEKLNRVSMDEDSNRLRENAFLGQEWTTKYFGTPEATGNEYRVSFKGHHYYLERLAKLPDGKESHGYTGLMVHENDLLPMVQVLVQAVRERQKKL